MPLIRLSVYFFNKKAVNFYKLTAFSIAYLSDAYLKTTVRLA